MADSVGKARSTSKEKALDARIREIQLRSRASEERQKVCHTVRRIQLLPLGYSKRSKDCSSSKGKWGQQRIKS